MNAGACPRSWEIEAAHDGRLDASSLAAHQSHVAHCAACARERETLLKLSATLQASEPIDELVLRRVRQRILSNHNQRALAPVTSRARMLWWCVALATAALALSVGRWYFRVEPSASQVALQLSPEPGARYAHVRHGVLEDVRLHDGGLAIAFHRATPAAGLIVRVPDGEIRDMGTVFRVVVAAGRTQQISVQHGAVIFHRRGHATIVRAGEMYVSPPEQPASPASAQPSTSDASVPPPAAAPAAANKFKHHHTHPQGPQPGQAEHATAAPQDTAYVHILGLLNEHKAEEARAAAQEYLRLYPHGFRREEVRRIATPP